MGITMIPIQSISQNQNQNSSASLQYHSRNASQHFPIKHSPHDHPVTLSLLAAAAGCIHTLTFKTRAASGRYETDSPPPPPPRNTWPPPSSLPANMYRPGGIARDGGSRGTGAGRVPGSIHPPRPFSICEASGALIRAAGSGLALHPSRFACREDPRSLGDVRDERVGRIGRGWR